MDEWSRLADEVKVLREQIEAAMSAYEKGRKVDARHPRFRPFRNSKTKRLPES